MQPLQTGAIAVVPAVFTISFVYCYLKTTHHTTAQPSYYSDISEINLSLKILYLLTSDF